MVQDHPESGQRLEEQGGAYRNSMENHINWQMDLDRWERPCINAKDKPSNENGEEFIVSTLNNLATVSK